MRRTTMRRFAALFAAALLAAACAADRAPSAPLAPSLAITAQATCTLVVPPYSLVQFIGGTTPTGYCGRTVRVWANPPSGFVFWISSAPWSAVFPFGYRAQDSTANPIVLDVLTDGQTLAPQYRAAPLLPTASMVVSPAVVAFEGNAVVSWSCANSTSGVARGLRAATKRHPAYGPWIGLTGSQHADSLAISQRFVVTCTSPLGVAADTVRITVLPPA